MTKTMLTMALLAAAVAGPAQAQKISNVQVVNTAADPVPVSVQGTPAVTVSNTPSVTVANSPTVQLAAGSQVTVANAAPLPVRDADQAARNAFQAVVQIGATEGKPIAIPAGKRLVIEFVTISGTTASAGGAIQPVILLQAGLPSGGANFYLEPLAVGVTSQFGLSQQVTVYADSLTIGSGYSGFAPLFFAFNVAISGHLVDL